MARGFSACDTDSGGGGGGGGCAIQYIGRFSSTVVSETSSSFSSPADPFRESFYGTSLDRDIGDVFFGTDDLAEAQDFMFKEDVMEPYRREAAMKNSRRKRKEGFGCAEFLNLIRCIFCVRY